MGCCSFASGTVGFRLHTLSAQVCWMSKEACSETRLENKAFEDIRSKLRIISNGAVFAQKRLHFG